MCCICGNRRDVVALWEIATTDLLACQRRFVYGFTFGSYECLHFHFISMVFLNNTIGTSLPACQGNLFLLRRSSGEDARRSASSLPSELTEFLVDVHPKGRPLGRKKSSCLLSGCNTLKTRVLLNLLCEIQNATQSD